MTPSQFDHIRCYEKEDMPAVIDSLMNDEQFSVVLEKLFPNVPKSSLEHQLRACTDTLDFQKKFIYPIVNKIMSAASTELTSDFSSLSDKDTAYTFISNHRDIVLDSALLSMLLLNNGFPTTVEIAIGDNLLAYPWIRHIVRLNKAFIVQRSLGLRETLIASKQLSQYMHYVITQKNYPIWIAQREGRAKDSNDRTQESVLKMIAMGSEKNALESIREMNIVPLTISYEYDPCDYLKAREFQLKRDNPDYKKTREDDLQNMQTGIYGFKGRVHYQAAPPVNSWLDTIASLPKGEFFSELARRMDQEIFKGYRLFPANYAAHDMLGGSETFVDQYTPADKEHFEAYVEQQLAKIDIPHKDTPFLRERLLQMYANPLRNKLSLQS